MYQILLKDDFKYSPAEFKLFIEQCNALFSVTYKELLKDLFKPQKKVEMYVYCNEDEMIEIYFDTTDKENEYMLEGFLKTIFSKEEVFKSNRKFDMKLHNTITKYNGNYKNYSIREFNHVNNQYILNSLVSHTGYKVSFYYENDESIMVNLKVFSEQYYRKNEIKNVCSTVQQVTSVQLSESGKKVKLHVKYNDERDRNFKVTINELMNFTFIPYDYDRILTTSEFANYIDEGTMDTGICIGNSLHPAQCEKKVYISADTLREHVFICGKTGAGKSAELEKIVKSVLEENQDVGFTLFDPKANAVTGIINIIEKLIIDETLKREEIYSKVKVIDFGNKEAIFKINLLDKSMDITVLLNYFRDIFKSTGVRLEKIITNSIGLLMCDTVEHYIGDVLRLLKDNHYRMDILQRVKYNNEAKLYYDFFNTKAEFKEEEISPIESRITPFQKDNHTFEMFNSGDDLKILEWMENGDIILFNMASFSDIEFEIVAGYIELKYFLNAKKRRNNALSHFLIIDECHNVQNDIHEKIHAEGRSQGLHLILMTQFLEQMKTSILKSILEASATKIILKQGSGGSELAKNIGTSQSVLQELDKMTAIVKTIVEDKDTFVKIKIDPPYRYDLKGDIIPYKVRKEGKEVLNPQLALRESQLVELSKEIMKEQFPKKQGSNVINDHNTSRGFKPNNDVFI